MRTYVCTLVCTCVQVFTIPAGCAGASCSYMARWSRDGDDLLFELSASTNGWVAIALSGDAQMSGEALDDVIACQAEVGGEAVNAKDMNNPTGGRMNVLDAVSRARSDVYLWVAGVCVGVCLFYWECKCVVHPACCRSYIVLRICVY